MADITFDLCATCNAVTVSSAQQVVEMQAEIERLRAALRDALSYSTVGDMPVTIYENARAALEEGRT